MPRFTLLIFSLLLLWNPETTAQTDSLPDLYATTDTISVTDTSVLARLSAFHWTDEDGLNVHFTPYGAFEDDAGESHRRKHRYLMGRWTLDTTQTHLTLSIDYLMGEDLVDRRYRRERDFYIPYTIVALTDKELVLLDEVTDRERRFTAFKPEAYEEPAVRRIPKPKLGLPTLSLPKSGGWN